MISKRTVYISLIVLLFLNGILLGMIFHSQDQSLRVSFLDVGQGDAILISQGAKQILIDGGPSDGAILEQLGRGIPFWDKEIEVVVATHPDADHLSGLVDALEKYKVNLVLDSGMESDTQVFHKFQELVSEKKIRTELAREGTSMKIGENTELEILSPFSDFAGGKLKDTNLNSIVSKLEFGKNSFLFMADAPVEREQELMRRNTDLTSKVLKVGHHGSKYSTNQEFLEKVMPADAVLSVGRNNRYGHPAPEVLDELKKQGINIFRTDEIGNIVYVCQNMETTCQREI